MKPADDRTPDNDLEKLITMMPKVELHVHLEGSLSPDLLVELTRDDPIPGVPRSRDEVREWFTFRDFPHFVDVFDAVVGALRGQDDFTRLVECVAADLARQQVRYAELIFTPFLHLRRGVRARAMFDGLEAGRRHAESTHGVILRWIADFPGHLGVEAGDATVDAVLEADVPAVVGLSVGGIEVERGQFATVFDRARAAGLHSAPHAGETHGADRIWSALRDLGAERIGHGIRSLEDAVLVDHLRRAGIALDVCPTSNYRTGAVPAGQPHPLPALIDAGLVVTLNSDDPAMFGTTLLDEYRAAARMGIGHDGIVALARNGVLASFQSDAEKDALLREIDQGVAAGSPTTPVGPPSPPCTNPSPAGGRR